MILRSNWASQEQNSLAHKKSTGPRFPDMTLFATEWLLCKPSPIKYSLTSPYGHLCKADTWFGTFGVHIKEVWLYRYIEHCMPIIGFTSSK